MACASPTCAAITTNSSSAGTGVATPRTAFSTLIGMGARLDHAGYRAFVDQRV